MVMRRALTAALAAIGAVLLAHAALAAPDPAVQADALLARAKAAMGGAAWDRIAGWHERGTIERRGGPITYETWLDVGRPGMISQITGGDGRWQTRGFDGQAAWVIDDSEGAGVERDEKAVSAARRDDYFSLYGFFFPERFAARRTYIGTRATAVGVYDVVRVQPAGCPPMDLWVDRKSHQLAAVVDPDPAHPLIAFLGDFKPTNGVLLPYTVMQSAGGAESTSVRRITAYDFAPVDAKRFRPPAQ
jgi:hypothetical protein